MVKIGIVMAAVTLGASTWAPAQLEGKSACEVLSQADVEKVVHQRLSRVTSPYLDEAGRRIACEYRGTGAYVFQDDRNFVLSVRGFPSKQDGVSALRQLAAKVLAGMVAIGVAPDATGVSAALDRWNALAVDAAVRVARRTQTVSTIEVAIVQAAVYNAVNAVEQAPYEPFGVALVAPPWASAEAAVARAAHDMLVWLYPAQAPELDAQLAAWRAAVPDAVARDEGENVGAAAARGMIALRTNDGRDAPVDFVPRTGLGAWTPTPPAFLPAQTPWVARMKPFAIRTASDLRPGPPPSLGSATYADALNEVRTRGARIGSTRTAAETAQALFWSDDFTTLYNRYLRALALEQRVAGANQARLFAVVNMAAADGLIACMDAKYAYSFWRPVTAMAAADADGNPRTSGDPEWQPLLTTPNHPEYPSAHSCGSQAVVSALAAFFGTDRVRSTVESTVEGAGPPRTFERFSDLYEDVDRSRIFGGLHYRFSMTAGRGIGLRAARYLVRHHFRRYTARARGTP